MVYARPGYFSGEAPFDHPVLVQQLSESGKVLFIIENIERGPDHLMHLVQLLLLIGSALYLFGRYVRGGPGKTRKEDHQMILERLYLLGAERDRLDMYMFRASEAYQVESAESGQDLVLRTDVFFHGLLFQMDRVQGKLSFGGHG